MLDRMDRKILDILQKDCTMPVAEIGKQIGLSTTPCWRRIQKLEESGIIQRRVALLDAKKVNVGVTVFVSITTSHHTQEWLDQFHEALKDFPEVVEFYRMSGQVDYLLRVVVPDIERYDAFYKTADRQDRAVRCELGLRHGADQIYDVAAARLRGRVGALRASVRAARSGSTCPSDCRRSPAPRRRTDRPAR